MISHKISSKSLLLILITILLSGIYNQISAQKSTVAVLREIENGPEMVKTMEATLPFKVDDAECRTDPVKCFAVNSTIYDGGEKGILFEDINAGEPKKVAVLNIEAAENCSANNFPTKSGTFCLKISEDNFLVVIYRFITPPVIESDKYSINSVIRRRPPADQPAAAGEVRAGYSSAAKLEFPINDPQVAVISDTERTENKNLKAMYVNGGREEEIVADNNIIRIRIKLPDKGSRADDKATQLKNSRITIKRTRALLNWLDRQQSNPADIATVQTDLRDGSPVANYQLSGFAYLEQNKNHNDSVAAPRCSQFEPDIPAEIQPLTERELAVYCDSRLTIYLIGKNNLPTKTFFFKVSLENDPPLELAAVAKVTPVGTGIKSLATPDAKTVGENKTLGLRSFNSNLDFGFALTSSVKNDQNARKRDNKGSFDLMFAPVLNSYLTGPTRWQLLTTPFFIDTKASLDKNITKDTLSLNRILIGSELSLLHLGKFTQGDSTHPADYDKYKYSFRFINASDRDFKRVEAKFNFETLVRLVALNKPLSQRVKSVPPSPLNPKAGPAAVPAGKFGYQIQPIIGFEVGRVYRENRSAFASENQERFVRRFYFGLDMQYDLTRLAKISLKDTYYIRGEVNHGRYRNYFLGEFSTPIGKIGDRGAQSIFLSFERGEQPPFVSPSVNAFKVGYRITANIFDHIPIP